MTRFNWKKASLEGKMRRQGAQLHEDALPRGPSPRDDIAARPEDFVRKRNTPKHSNKPKIGKDGLTKNQRRKLVKKKEEAKEAAETWSFRAALANPASNLRKAAEETRRRWAKASKLRQRKTPE